MARRFGSRAGRTAPAPSSLKSSRRCMGPPKEGTLRSLVCLHTAVLHRHLPGCAQGGDGFAFGDKFHDHIPIKAQLAKLAEDIWIINLPGAGFVAAGDIGDMYHADDLKILVQFL